MFRESQKIGSYTLISKLGKGGFGEVWLAEKRSQFVTKKVALKLPLDEQVDFEAIRQEATLWEQASGHANVLPIIDADIFDGQVVIVSEYADGGSLEQWLKTNGAMPVEQAIQTTIQILDGLEFLHSRNIIHRDLKPANILLQGNTPRLADFGISRALRTTVTSQSQNISGTFAYMSPEALDGKRSVQTDIWSVGVNLYQFLTGTLPFPNSEPSQLLAAIMMREYAPLPTEVPQNLQIVIAKALAKKLENRYKTANEMREDLRRILRDETVSEAVQTDLPKTQASFPASAIPPTQKCFPISANHLQGETATVVRHVLSHSENGKPNIRNIWLFSVFGLIFIVGLFGFWYYLPFNKSEQKNSNQIENSQLTENLQNSSSNLENSNVISNANLNSPTPIPVLNKSQVQKTVNGYISRIIKASTKEYGYPAELLDKKFLYDDVDNDGDEDIIGLITVSGTGHPTTNFSMLVIFSNKTGNAEFTADKNINAIFAHLTSVKGSKISITTDNYSDDDPACCPSIRKNSVYELRGNNLESVK